MNRNFKENNKFPTINKNNTDAWNDITYGYIIKGMLASNPDLQYDEAVGRADVLTQILFNALKFKLENKK